MAASLNSLYLVRLILLRSASRSSSAVAELLATFCGVLVYVTL